MAAGAKSNPFLQKETMQFDELVRILQVAIGPVIVISGVGLLLLSMTNRLGRVIDRAREIADHLRRSPGAHSQNLSQQLGILANRARIIRLSIACATIAILLTALLIIALFMTSLMRVDGSFVMVLLFIACMLSLIVSLLFFLRDINLSLAALHLEMDYTGSLNGNGKGKDEAYD